MNIIFNMLTRFIGFLKCYYDVSYSCFSKNRTNQQLRFLHKVKEILIRSDFNHPLILADAIKIS